MPLVENDFETPVFTEHPLLEEIKQRLVRLGAEVALLSGSGATMFGVFSDQIGAERAAAVLGRDPKTEAYAVPTAGAPVISIA